MYLVLCFFESWLPPFIVLLSPCFIFANVPCVMLFRIVVATFYCFAFTLLHIRQCTLCYAFSNRGCHLLLFCFHLASYSPMYLVLCFFESWLPPFIVLLSPC